MHNITKGKPVWALGLMSGTSMDGVDAALVLTDGETIAEFGPHATTPYDRHLRERLFQAAAGKGDTLALEHAITLAHAEAVEALLASSGFSREKVGVIGFHGQTIIHRPKEALTWQLADGALLAERTGIDVVADFRRRDMAAGGSGAPLVPLFHAALAAKLEAPVAFLNIGGVANVTWIGSSDPQALDLLAFDTGPGNALLDDWMLTRTGKTFDEGGATALAGAVNKEVLFVMLEDEYFSVKPPKSLDRNHFASTQVSELSTEDGAATLAAFTAKAVEAGTRYFREQPKRWLVCGGGRHNRAIMHHLQQTLGKVEPVEAIGCDGDAIEAQAFAYFAVRSLRGLPLTLPSTTGVTRAVTGGAFFRGGISSSR